MFHQTMNVLFCTIIKVEKTQPKPRPDQKLLNLQSDFPLPCNVLEDSSFKHKFWCERNKGKKKIGINAVCWTAAKRHSRALSIRTRNNLTWVHSREQLWGKTLCVFTVTSFWHKGEWIQSKDLGVLKRCLEQNRDKSLSSVLTLAVSVCDS